MFNPEELNNKLYDFNRSTPNIIASVIVDSDGLILASQIPSTYDEDTVGGMSAALLSLAERTLEEFQGGNIEQVLVRGERLVTVLMSINKQAVLGVSADAKVKLGLLFLSMKKSIEELRKVM